MLWAVMFSVQNALSNQPDRVYAFKFSLTGDNPIPSIPLLYASGTTFFMICNAALTSLLIMIFFSFSRLVSMHDCHWHRFHHCGLVQRRSLAVNDQYALILFAVFAKCALQGVVTHLSSCDSST